MSMFARFLLSIGIVSVLSAFAKPTPAVNSCSDSPQTGAAGDWSNARRHEVKAWGEPHHRGIDLITAEDSQQVISGETHYTHSVRGKQTSDKALEHETIEVLACRDNDWTLVGKTETDREGRFQLHVPKETALRVGLTKLYLSVVGDRSGAGFLALIAPPNTELVVSDVDGTLTDSENAFPDSLFTHRAVAANDGAPRALETLRKRGYWIVYLTSRGQFFTEATRRWLRDKGFPNGPLRLAEDFVTLPGHETVEYKSGAMKSIVQSHFIIGVGIGNRRSDKEAYSAVGVPTTAIYIFRKERRFFKEVDPLRAQKKAVVFESYTSEQAIFQALPLVNSSAPSAEGEEK